MKFQRIGTGYRGTRMVIFAALLLALGGTAYAVDEDIPPPADSDIPAPKSSVGPKKNANDSVLNEDESIPAPSLGDDSLPEPTVDRGQEKSRNQVNKMPEDDEIFLPTPNVNDSVYYAPVGTPAPRVTAEDLDWRYLTTNRPHLQICAGVAFKSYPNELVQSARTTGYGLGASYRILSLGQTLFLHFLGNWTYFNVGDVGSVADVRDQTLHLGGVLELGVGRHLSLFTTLLRRQAYLAARPRDRSNFTYRPDITDLGNLGEQPNWLLGIGGQWDFYVIPHGSVGLRLFAERDFISATLAVALEPAPPKKLTLNYGDMND